MKHACNGLARSIRLQCHRTQRYISLGRCRATTCNVSAVFLIYTAHQPPTQADLLSHVPLLVSEVDQSCVAGEDVVAKRLRMT
eukprot:scaffold52729_cov15-Prasinocladus_malaysianus.AAC.1